MRVCLCVGGGWKGWVVGGGDTMTEEKIEIDRTKGKRMGKLSRLARQTETEG